MSELQRFNFEADGQIYEINISPTATEKAADPFERRGVGVQTDAIAKMQQARQMIRGYAMYALSAFKDFGAAEIEEVTLKFGLKLGGKAGIPYITEGSAESNLEIQVKCKFPAQQKPSSTQ